MSTTKYYGKYRGTVVNNIDPNQTGRIQVLAPDVSGSLPSTWALPCFPVAGMNTGFFAVPAIGSLVWVEFEQGDPDYPIWVGCFYASAAEVPTLAKTAPAPISAITLQTTLNNGIVISDAMGPMGTGGIVLKSATGSMVAVSDVGITITNGKGATIMLTGPTVNINSGALTVV